MHELLTPAEMSKADQLAGDGETLMQAAGRAVARAVMRHYPPCRVAVLTGPGNNGGDGRVAARYLEQQGWSVAILPFATASIEAVAKADLVIDAIFGAGLSRDIAPPIATLLQAAKRIVAIDTPSGVDGATGAIRGYAAQAELTITFFRLKPGHLLYPGRGLCGETSLADIGLPASVLNQIKPQTWQNNPSLWSLPSRSATGHKYSHGDVTVLCGTMPGAARLACAAARRAGAGMVTLHTDTYFIPPEAGLIVSAAPLETLIADPRRRVWVCGPGLGIKQATIKLAALIAAQKQIIADADALTACTDETEKLRGTTVITPHLGEFTRVFGPPGPDKLAAVRAAARITNAVTILKGPDTIIAAPDGRAAINANAPPYLATGGTGDILAGIIAALLAQNMPAFEATCAAVWYHGQAASLAGPGMIAEDLPGHLARVMRA
ncbi:MAG: NAD(P)H-hydrate dehydratase [Acidocella sp. 20-57-95]|nr:MAG: NAD(P)H-hydrate dehydratase [Acidocella sp. 20-57-95]OYV59757.1 MAG: NAD(P)H-hydrate dehydratase [Acidocella sp. 21-58-7]HQU05228.1 NAD(P)H-hydrate dehydratase [Acidocella sp.]